MFSSMRKLFVYIEVVHELKNMVMVEVVENSNKIQQQSYTFIH